MSRSIPIILTILITANSLYTSSFFEKKGINVKDNIFPEEKNDNDIKLSTVCNPVDLTAAPFNYTSLVWSGYLNVNKGGSGLAFMFYGKQGASKEQIKDIPTIIWLNGGPGSSSQLGNFMELGPSFVKPANLAPWEIVSNKHTWVKEYNVLFVDQPVGTGLSYADPNYSPSAYCNNMDDVAADFYYALKELYFTSNGCFNQLGITGDRPLFIFGQSYAGKYAPAIGAKLKLEQKKGENKITGLKGVAIGDGFTHPINIMHQVGEYAFNLGLIDYQERTMIEHIILNTTYQERIKDWRGVHDSFDKALDLIVYFAGGVNVYDITKYHDYPTQLLESFFEDTDMITKFKLNAQVEYGAQAGNVYEHLYQDFMMEYTELVHGLLNWDVQVLVYNGQNDLIVETPGTFKWVERLLYPQIEQFRDTLMKEWRVDGKVAGFNKKVGNLELRTVNNAGHLVPMDQGHHALEMVKEFVQRSL